MRQLRQIYSILHHLALFQAQNGPERSQTIQVHLFSRKVIPIWKEGYYISSSEIKSNKITQLFQRKKCGMKRDQGKKSWLLQHVGDRISQASVADVKLCLNDDHQILSPLLGLVRLTLSNQPACRSCATWSQVKPVIHDWKTLNSNMSPNEQFSVQSYTENLKQCFQISLPVES